MFPRSGISQALGVSQRLVKPRLPAQGDARDWSQGKHTRGKSLLFALQSVWALPARQLTLTDKAERTSLSGRRVLLDFWHFHLDCKDWALVFTGLEMENNAFVIWLLQFCAWLHSWCNFFIQRALRCISITTTLCADTNCHIRLFHI